MIADAFNHKKKDFFSDISEFDDDIRKKAVDDAENILWRALKENEDERTAKRMKDRFTAGSHHNDLDEEIQSYNEDRWGNILNDLDYSNNNRINDEYTLYKHARKNDKLNSEGFRLNEARLNDESGDALLARKSLLRSLLEFNDAIERKNRRDRGDGRLYQTN